MQNTRSAKDKWWKRHKAKRLKHADENLVWGFPFYDSQYKIYIVSIQGEENLCKGRLPRSSRTVGRTIPASKEDAQGGVVSDEEEERMVCVELHREHCRAEHHDRPGSSSSLSSLLIDFHKSFVNHLREDQVVLWGHAWQAGEWGRFLITIRSILMSKSHLEKGSYQRSRSWPRRRHPPCPSWPGRSSCQTSAPAWSGAGPPGRPTRPSCLDGSTQSGCHRWAASPAEGDMNQLSWHF